MCAHVPFMCVCLLYLASCVHVCVCMSLCMRAYVHECRCICVNIHEHRCICVHVFISCVYVNYTLHPLSILCLQMSIQLHCQYFKIKSCLCEMIHVYIYTYIYTYTYKHMRYTFAVCYSALQFVAVKSCLDEMIHVYVYIFTHIYIYAIHVYSVLQSVAVCRGQELFK